jgi:hypothetical protein
MQFREHPLVAYRGYSTWPPIWVGIRVRGPSPPGEYGRLIDVRSYPDKPCRLFLTMEHAGAEYVGCLLFDEAAYCDRVTALLQNCCGMLIKEIGDLDVPLPLDLAKKYRKTFDCQMWHCCSNCSHWPTDEYLEEMMLPSAVPLCNECKSLLQDHNCVSG